jgi:two-component system, NtrC family, response regulator AtoC
MNPSILVVDDEQVFRLLAEEALASEGFEVRTAETLRKARAEFERGTPDVVVMDRRMPDGDGIDFLRTLRAEAASGRPGGDSSGPIVIVVTAYGDVDNAVAALKEGASDYLTKPVQITDLIVKLRKVLEAQGLRDRLAIARSGAAPLPMVEPSSGSMREAMERLRKVAVSPLTPVFLYGPSGVGKQRAAELLHALTWLKNDPEAPFLEVNCAALPTELVESELFGHERGAFTDARNMRRGLIEMAAGGTLFLDEITELPQRSQAKLLKFLDTMRFRRLGGEREIAVELRVVAATNQDVRQAVATGRFREDLYHRLAVFWLSIPPLQARREDIPELALSFVRFFAGRVKKKVTGITPPALSALASYDYPGNVRELRNIIERAVILARGADLEERDIVLPGRSLPPPSPATEPPFFSLAEVQEGKPPSLEEVEKAYVARILEFCGGKRGVAAQALGISYPTLLKRVRELGLE